MHTVKKLLIVLLALSLLLAGSTLAAGAEVILSYEGEPINAAGVSAFLDEGSGTVMASVPFFTEVIGLTAEFDEESKTLTLSRNRDSIVFVMDDTAVANEGSSILLDAAPTLRNGIPCLPLRFTAEHFGFDLTWHGEERRVDVRPADRYELGISETRMRELYGTPEETRQSEKGYIWQVYNADLSDYRMVGLDGDQVTAYYICSGNWKLPFGIQSGMRLAACNTIMNSLGFHGSSGTGYVVYTDDVDALTVYYSSDVDNSVYAALYEEARYLTRCEITPSVLSAMEDTLADLTNAMRIRKGLDPLAADERVSTAAGDHAGDMAQNDFFSHMGSDGTDKSGRMEKAGFQDFYVSEALCKAFSDSFEVFASFYGNASYQEILFANFTTVGSGFSYNPNSEGILYGVQLFFAEKD